MKVWPIVRGDVHTVIFAIVWLPPNRSNSVSSLSAMLVALNVGSKKLRNESRFVACAEIPSYYWLHFCYQMVIVWLSNKAIIQVMLKNRPIKVLSCLLLSSLKEHQWEQISSLRPQQGPPVQWIQHCLVWGAMSCSPPQDHLRWPAAAHWFVSLIISRAPSCSYFSN